MRTFYALVEFSDVNGTHPAGHPVNLPYETDEDIANAQSMIRYGVVAEQAPASASVANNENPVFAGLAADTGQVVLTPNDENPVDASEPAPIAEVSPPEEPAVDAVATDDPETPYFDARGDDGQFAKEGTPVEEPAPAPKKATRRKR